MASFYEQHVLPHVIGCACGAKPIQRQRMNDRYSTRGRATRASERLDFRSVPPLRQRDHPGPAYRLPRFSSRVFDRAFQRGGSRVYDRQQLIHGDRPAPHVEQERRLVLCKCNADARRPSASKIFTGRYRRRRWSLKEKARLAARSYATWARRPSGTNIAQPQYVSGLSRAGRLVHPRTQFERSEIAVRRQARREAVWTTSILGVASTTFG